MKNDKFKLINPHREMYEATKHLISAFQHAYGIPKEKIEACLITLQFEDGDKERFDRYVEKGGTRCIACFDIEIPVIDVCPKCGKPLIVEIMVPVSSSYGEWKRKKRRLKPIRKRGSKK